MKKVWFLVTSSLVLGGELPWCMDPNIWPEIWSLLKQPVQEPEMIEAQWRQMEAWAEPSGRNPNEPGSLIEAASLIRQSPPGSDFDLDRVLAELESLDARYRIAPDLLPEHLAQAVEGLIRWLLADGGLGKDMCEPNFKLVSLLDLGKLSLAVAPDSPSSPQVTAVLRLGHLLRHEGNILAFMAGMGLYEKALKWSRWRCQPLGDEFLRFRPLRSDLFFALVRDSVCSARFFDRVAKEKTDVFSLSLSFKEYHYSLFTMLEPIKDDPARMVEMIDRYATWHQDPFTAILRTPTSFLSNVVLDFEKLEKTLDTALDSSGRTLVPLSDPACQASARKNSVVASKGGPKTAPVEDLVPDLLKVGEDHFSISRESFERIWENPAGLSAQARVIPAFHEGRVIGFKLFAIRKGSVYERIGIHDNDILTHLDGMKTSDPESFLQAAERMKRGKSFELQLLRRGQVIRIRVDLRASPQQPDSSAGSKP